MSYYSTRFPEKKHSLNLSLILAPKKSSPCLGSSPQVVQVWANYGFTL